MTSSSAVSTENLFLKDQSEEILIEAEVPIEPKSANNNNEKLVASPTRRFSFPLRGASSNPVLDASQPLLALVTRVWGLKEHDDIGSLHKQLSTELESIEIELHKHGYDRVNILAHRYCLCSVIDESIMSSPWGQDSDWSERSLLATFHNETWGGEKFFVVLERLMMEPSKYLDLIEFMYICMCLGFEGKYRVKNNGKQELEEIIHEVHRVIREERGDAPEYLTAYDENQSRKTHKIRKQTPIGLIVLFFAVIMMAIYAYFFNESQTTINATLDALNNVFEGN